MKLGIVSHLVPPATGGQAMLIYRLLRGLDPDAYCLISQQREEGEAGQRDDRTRLSGPYRHLPAERVPGGEVKLLRGLLLPAALRARSRRIAELLREERCDAVVAFTGDLLNLPAAALAARAAGIPYFVYVCDYYSYQWVNPALRLVARRLEPSLLRRASGVIVPSEFMRDELRRRFGVDASVIHHACDLALYEDPPPAAMPSDEDVRIVYTGAISPAQSDALQSLLRAAELLEEDQVGVHIYTGQSAAVLEHLGIHGRFVHHGHEPPSAMPAVQRSADLLFLPLSIDSPYPELIRTAAPFKMGEYLAARRPILIHAPPDCFLSWYFRRYECGLVVDQPDPEMLAEAIVQLASDETLQEGLAARAWERARLDFDSERARRSFLRAISTG